ncbi:putative aromatic amino acid aminotransferase [Echria macrotheca]|uniref:Aromatic amino acid aminotransferase n=1 Tax=Echria macrotheca TaxID=438768 RepID=A0AAJ0FH88_9PEZI|nr:putative aromatic amino acid aminotransferase [Echria macrotheca]
MESSRSSAAAAKMSGSEKPLPVDLSHHFNFVTRRRLPSKIKAYYKLFGIPGIRNLAGGLPNAQFFPFDTLEAQAAKPDRWTPSPNGPGQRLAQTSSEPPSQAANHIAVPKASAEADLSKKIDLSTALQYGQSQGYPALLSWVRQFTRENLHPDVPYRGGPEVAMTCGSTDGFAKTLQIFVEPWNEDIHPISERPGLLCETFIYGSILTQSLPLGMHVAPVKADAGGMVVKGPGGLEDVLANWDDSKGKRPHLMYTVTQGHNPTGVVLSIERKREIYAVCSKYDVIIVEDEPYWYLQFPSAATEEAKSRGLPAPPAVTPPHKTQASSGYEFLDSLTPSFVSIDVDGRVVRLDTFSKTIAPGCRLGWITAQPEVIERYVRISETSTQQPSGFVQSLVAELVMGPQPEATKSAFARALASGSANKFTGWHMDGWIRWLEGLRGSYERRMARMCRILDSDSSLLLSSSSPSSEWSVITKTKLIDFSWPRGGMFIWLRVRLETHPLYGISAPETEGESLALAMTMFLTTKPYLVLVSGGSMFSATEEIRRDRGWSYFRLCFAAESEENIEASAQRFVEGVKDFWKIRSVREIKKLLGMLPKADGVDEEDAEVFGAGCVQLGGWLGC